MFPQIACFGRCIVTLIAFVLFFSTVHFQMSPEIICLNGCIITQAAFVCLFSTVRSQMSLQITRIIWCIIALVAFVWFFSTVRRQMCPQMTGIYGCIITLAAFVWLFSTVHLHVSSKHLHMRMHNHTCCSGLNFPHCAFPSVSSNRLPERMHSDIGCIFLVASSSYSFQDFSPSLL